MMGQTSTKSLIESLSIFCASVACGQTMIKLRANIREET